MAVNLAETNPKIRKALQEIFSGKSIEDIVMQESVSILKPSIPVELKKHPKLKPDELDPVYLALVLTEVEDFYYSELGLKRRPEQNEIEAYSLAKHFEKFLIKKQGLNSEGRVKSQGKIISEIYVYLLKKNKL